MDLGPVGDFIKTVGEAIGGFVAGLTPGDIVTGALALGAVIVSIVALRQSAQAHPRPSIRVSSEWQMPNVYTTAFGEPDEWEEVTFKLLNRGSGVAYDVRCEAPASKPSVITELGALKLDEPVTWRLNFLQVPKGARHDARISWTEYPPAKGKRRHQRVMY